MSIVDTIKKSVLENFSGTITATDMLLSLVVAFLIGIFIIYVYRKTYTGVVYSKAFSLCILMLAMVTAMIIRTISSNISLSLGMVGALSIVRFRTAVKEPVDTGFMFWGISAGIMAGAGLYIPALVASLGVGILYYVTYLMGFRTANRYLLVLKYEASAHDDVLKKLKTVKKFKIRSKSIFGKEVELSLEVDIKENNKKKVNIDTAIVDQFNGMPGVINASLISYQNDFGD
ncbi:MAG: DUF4956 domain-containing protein [Bacilli bacterium]|jgi:uncharacterized membrane protein YhiD involved in acid resistance|nr:DUF4956 domain-containing protein [Bacilli bacterium]